MPENKIKKVTKRNGGVVDFDQEKITSAVLKAITATGQGDGEISKKVSDRVIQILNRRFKEAEIPHVEQIQDIVEEVLILEGLVETAKAYILYREQRRRIREATTALDESLEMVDKYIKELDWQIKENANMAYSLQGLNYYGVSAITKKYWLNKVYTQPIRDVMLSGDMHIHDLDNLSTYCCGWDLYDLLLRGFGGVSGKIESKPAKHFRTALGQLVNFFYTLQGESAGAQAISSFDTLLAPFIRYDNLDYHRVKQAVQEFLFNMAIPTRVGFQCLSEDTEILTPAGWKSHKEVKEKDSIYTFNVKSGELEEKTVDTVFAREYKGKMYNLRNRSQNQLISPRHRVVRQVFNADKYILEPIEDILNLKSPVSIPVSCKNTNPDIDVSDEQLQLMAWTLSEGTIEKDGSHRVSIYQSLAANQENYQEIVGLLDGFDFDYSSRLQTGLGTCNCLRLSPTSSKVLHQWFGETRKVFPQFLFRLSHRQARLFLETYIRGDGWKEKYRKRITVTNEESLKALEAISVLAGYNFSVKERKPQGISKKIQHIITLTEAKHDYIQEIKAVDYQGIIWSVHTTNETVIAKRGGQVFVTGNTPFTNITLDITPPSTLAKQPVIIGGKPQNETYADFQPEMDMIVRAFYEGLMEGDAKGRPFTFPISTVNITPDFDWESKTLEPLWEATAKYGVNYFSNFINSEMKPEDARSMCLDAKEEVLVRNSRKIKRISIKEVADKYKDSSFDKEGWAECKKEGGLEALSLSPRTLKLEWSPVKRFLRVVDSKTTEIITADGKMATFSLKHPVPIYTQEGIKMKFAKDVERGDYLMELRKAGDQILSQEHQAIEDIILNEDLAKILGYFVADGNYLFENRKGFTHFGQPRGLQFTFKTGDEENIKGIRSLIKKAFQLECKEKQDLRYNAYYLYVYNSTLARKLYNAGFKKYGRLPQSIFNSPQNVIKNFLEYHFKGDGYERRKEIHLNDLELSRDLVFLYSLVGQPVTYRPRKKSQTIYLQHAKSKKKKGNNNINTPILSKRLPGWLAVSTYKVPGLRKSRTVGFDTLEKYDAFTAEGLKLRDSDVYLTRVKTVKTKHYKQLKEFYDLELEKNHLFVHSLGQISFNCCRLKLDNRELIRRGGGLFGSQPLTGSIGVVTINLPRIGYLSKTKKDFFDNLERIMDLAKDSLEIKRKALENFMEKGLYPYSKHYLSGIKKMRGSYWGNHFSTIGILGMNEALLNFLEENIGSAQGRKFALEVLDFMREKLIKYQEETGNLYNLEATPAEGASYRLALKDKEKYPEIITAGSKEVPFYTNSAQLPVNYTDDIFEALKLQDEIQCKYTGGTVQHIFLGERISDVEMAKSLVKKVFENFKLPYISLTPTFSICPTHGYISGEHFLCPQCTIEQPCEVYSRIVGYLRPVQQWHVGKKEEFKTRKMYKIPENLSSAGQ